MKTVIYKCSYLGSCHSSVAASVKCALLELLWTTFCIITSSNLKQKPTQRNLLTLSVLLKMDFPLPRCISFSPRLFMIPRFSSCKLPSFPWGLNQRSSENTSLANFPWTCSKKETKVGAAAWGSIFKLDETGSPDTFLCGWSVHR